MKRIAADALLFGLVLFAPWWVSLPVAFGFSFLFQNFFELIVLGAALDILYGVPEDRFSGFQFILSAVSAALFVGSVLVKRRMRF